MTTPIRSLSLNRSRARRAGWRKTWNVDDDGGGGGIDDVSVDCPEHRTRRLDQTRVRDRDRACVSVDDRVYVACVGRVYVRVRGLERGRAGRGSRLRLRGC